MSDAPNSPPSSPAAVPALLPPAPAPSTSETLAPANPLGAVGKALEFLFGRSYRTTLAGWAAVACGAIVALNAAGVHEPRALVAAATALGPLVGGAGLLVAKDSRVTGLPK